jgi:hypothetical protein
MKGYLHRLAASVRPQSSRIRPAVTPLFARGSASDAAVEPELKEERLVLAARRDAPAPREADAQVAKLAPAPPPARAAPDFEAAASVERLVTQDLRATQEPRRVRASKESAAEVFEAPRPKAPANPV